MTQPLTAVERRVYEYLLDFTAENTFQPSIREIGQRFRIRSTKTVSDVLQSLAAKGFIQRDASRSRGVRLLGFAGVAGVLPVPYYGRIHAGEPALLPEHRVGFFTVDRRFIPSGGTFMLKVTGDSMIGAGILDGDYVLVDPTGSPVDGALVAVRVDEGSALKRLTRDDDQIVLRAENADVPDERIPPGETVDILGVVCGVFRTFHDAGTTPDHGDEQGADDGEESAPVQIPERAATPGTAHSLPQPVQPTMVS